MKRLTNNSENATLEIYYTDKEDRRIIKKIFAEVQDLELAINIFDNKDWNIYNGMVIVHKN